MATRGWDTVRCSSLCPLLRPALVPPLADSPAPVLDPASAVLILRIAGRPGPAFPLDAAADNRLGRAADSLVALADRLASRNHAVIRLDAESGAWTVRDLGSRNGTWLEGRRVEEAVLTAGDTIRIGTTELEFRTADITSPAAPLPANGSLVRCGLPAELEGGVLARMGSGGEVARWPLFLYQSGIRLLAADSPWQITCTTLELATECTAATSFGWFEPAASGELVATCVVPPGSGLESLLAGSVGREVLAGRAAWNSTATADIAGVPLVDRGLVRAVLGASASAGSLRESDFDMLVMLASLAAAAAAGRRAPAPAATDPLDEVWPASASEDELAEGTLALSEHELARLGLGGESPPVVPPAAGSLRLDDWQRALISEALRRSGGSVPEAAAALGISRATLYRRLDAWGLRRDGSPPSA